MAKQAAEKKEPTEAEMRASYKERATRVLATAERACRFAEKLSNSRVAVGSDAQEAAYKAEVERLTKRLSAAVNGETTDAASPIPDS